MICLNMIVKNEAPIIARCLRSVRPYIDAAYICDTGSTDGTPGSIYRELRDLEARAHVEFVPWEGFGPSRTRAAREAAGWLKFHSDGPDYLLFIDADETLEGDMPQGDDDPRFSDFTDVDVVYCRGVGPTLTWCNRLLLARASVPWKFEPITHESLMPADGRSIHDMRQLDWSSAVIRQHDDSARQKSGNKAAEDIALLTEWLREHPNDSRAQFYLARSFAFAGRNQEAFSAYAKRCEMRGGDKQEVVMSRIDMAKMQTEAGDFENAKLNYMDAYRLDPHRAEPLCGLASICVENRDLVTAEMAARQACALGRPTWRLFEESPAYDWIRWDLLIQALIGVGGNRRLEEAREIFRAHVDPVDVAPCMPRSEWARYEIVRKHLGIPGKFPDLTK